MFRRKPTTPVPAAQPAAAPEAQDHSILDQYVRSAPSDQNALDLFKDTWSSSMPEGLGLTAGILPTWADDRIDLILGHLGSVDGLKVLELGPLEAGHTYMMHKAGADVIAVEASARAYLKCLVVKEILDLERAKFELGDFMPYLHDTTEHFDLVLASGVLYHMQDPLDLLASIAKVTDKIAIWTHFWDRDAVASVERISRTFVDAPVDVEWRGRTLTLHPRHYLEALGWGGFCGGPEASAKWLERDGLMSVLADLGFSKITVLDESLAHVNGPHILFVAER